MKKIILSLLALLTLTSISLADLKNHHKEISSSKRDAIALKSLKENSNTIQIYTKGLICESCAIGVRKKLQRLKFVDKKKARKGIILDVRNQLVSVSIKDGKTIDNEAVKKAIKGAGYDPVTLYTLDSRNKLKTINLTQ